MFRATLFAVAVALSTLPLRAQDDPILPIPLPEESEALEAMAAAAPIIEIPEETTPGEALEAKLIYTPAEGESFRVVWSSDLKWKRSASGVYLWYVPSDAPHYVGATVIHGKTLADAEEIDVPPVRFYVRPLVPAKPLAELINNPATVEKLKPLYESQLKALISGGGTTTAQFRRAHDQYLINNGLSVHGGSDEINRRLDRVLSRGALLTPELRKLLIELIARIIEELTKPKPGPTPPPGPGPGPVIPTPSDPWGVQSTAQSVVAALSENVRSQAPATAALYAEVARKLETAEITSIAPAAAWIVAERKKLWGGNAAAWAPFEESVGQIWNSHWPLTKAQVIDFYKLTAAGLGAVR